MKGHLILLAMLLLVSCGKDSNGSGGNSSNGTQSNGISQASSTGLTFDGSYGNTVYILCESNDVSTNRQRIIELTNLRNSMNTSSGTTMAGISLNSYQMQDLMNQALGKLYASPLDTTVCPASILGKSY